MSAPVGNQYAKGNDGNKIGYGEKLELVKKYSALSDQVFMFLSEMLASEDKNDRKWATEQINKVFIKMIPQDVNADLNGNLTIQWAGQSQSTTPPENGPSVSTDQNSDGRS